MARVRQMAEQMGVSVDRAEDLLDRASALNDNLGFDEGGVNDKFAIVMKEFKDGTLRSGGSGKIVTDPDQAKAIAASYGKAGFKVGGVRIPEVSGTQSMVNTMLGRAEKRRLAEEKKRQKLLMAALKLGQTKKKDSSQAALVKKVFAGAKGGIVRGTRAQVRGRRFSGVY
jgi:hypothetical protein